MTVCCDGVGACAYAVTVTKQFKVGRMACDILYDAFNLISAALIILKFFAF